jgi:hypothetical protein
MKSLKHTPLYVGLPAGIVIGLLFASSSLGALLPWAIVLLCPVMMLLMMLGMVTMARAKRRGISRASTPSAGQVGRRWPPDAASHGCRGAAGRSCQRLVTTT